MRRHEYESPYNPAATELSRALIHDGGIRPDMFAKITNVLEGVKHTDEMISQKDTELQSKNNLLVQKDQILVQKESVIKEKDTELQSINHILAQKDIENQIAREALLRTEMLLSRAELSGFEAIRNEAIKMIEKAPNELALYKAYLHKTKGWLLEYEYLKDKAIEKNDHGQYGVEFWERQIVEQNGHANSCLEAIKDEADKIRNNATSELDHLKADLVNNEYWRLSYEFHRDIAVLKNNHGEYGIEFWGNKITECDNIEKHVLEALKKLEEDGKSTNKQLLNDKEQEIAKFKEMLSIREHELQEKQELLLAKELEKQELLVQKELEKQELLAQKEAKLHDKSLVKNQVINELQEDVSLKEKEALNLKIELLMRQVEFHKKESELKDKALEDAHEIAKQNKMINELQGKLLAVVDLHKEGKDIPNIELLKDQVNESILSGNVDDMKEFSKYLSQLMKNPADKDESLEISELLNNLSPVVHGEQNHVQNPLAVINNFDINHINTTHSVLVSMSGEESAFSIIQEESFH